MNFEKLEIYAKEATEARHRNQSELGKKLENDHHKNVNRTRANVSYRRERSYE